MFIEHHHKNLQSLPTVTSGTETTTVGIADSSGVHEIGGQLTVGTATNDASAGSSADGVMSAMPAQTTDSKVGTYAWDFDGDRIATISGIGDTFDSDWTISTWIKPSKATTWDPYFFGIGTTSTNDITVYSDDGNYWGGEVGASPEAGYYYSQQDNLISVDVDTWFHILLTWDASAGEVTYYVDNQSIVIEGGRAGCTKNGLWIIVFDIYRLFCRYFYYREP